jgi:trk system potassium uptake protein
MYIVIVGAGEVGSYLADMLLAERHDVVIIEQDEPLARRLDSRLDALVIHGSGVSQSVLTRAGVKKADLILAVTRVDEVNLITCMAAARMNARIRTVARVREVEYLHRDASQSLQGLGISLLVGPERAMAAEVVKLLSYQGSGEIHHLADGRLVLLEMPLNADSPFVHESLAQLREGDVFPSPSLVAAVRGPEGLRIPRGDDLLKVDERAYILTVPENAGEFLILSGRPWHAVRHVLIVGCGNIGYQLAKLLEAQKRYPTIIELDRARAEWLSNNLTKSIVLHGDGTEPDQLREQLAERADAVVVLIEDDEKAVLVGLMAKHLGARKVIVRSDKSAYTPIAHKLGVDAVISPRRAVAEEILRFVRRGRVSSAHIIGEHEGEILELRVPLEPSHPEIIERPLKELPFPEGALIGAVVRDGVLSIAAGETILQPGDGLLVITLPQAIARVERLVS